MQIEGQMAWKDLLSLYFVLLALGKTAYEGQAGWMVALYLALAGASRLVPVALGWTTFVILAAFQLMCSTEYGKSLC